MKLVIVLGSPRSGTTWVSRILGEHPEITRCTAETYLFPRLLAPLLQAWDDYTLEPVGLHRDLETETFEQACRELATSLLGRVLARTPGVGVLVEKTPANALAWPTALRLFPEAHFVHVLRDPRDVVCSLRAASGSWGDTWAPSSPVAATRLWQRHVDSALRIPEQTDRVRVVRYEALLGSGLSELEALFRFVGVDAGPAVCRRVLEETSFERLQKTLGTPGGFLRKGRSGNWRTELTLPQLRVVEYLAGDLMDALGYERSLPSPLRCPASVALLDALDGVWGAIRATGSRFRRRLVGVRKPRRAIDR